MTGSDITSMASSAVAELAKKHHEHSAGYAHQHVTHLGENVYYGTFIVFGITFLIFTVLTFQRPVGKRANSYCSLLIVGIATAAYYAMATGVGSVNEPISSHKGDFRQIFFARYIDWVFTTPLLLLDLLLLSNLPIGEFLWIVVADVAMIITGLISALVVVGKWGWFVAGCVFMVAVMVGLVVHGRRGALARGPEVGKLYSGLTLYLLVLWWCYPVVFFFAEGTSTISSNKEAIFYATLDILAKCVFGTIIFASHDTIDKANEAELSGGASILEAPLLGSSGGNDAI